MPSIFPDLFIYEYFAPFILRMGIVLILLILGIASVTCCRKKIVFQMAKFGRVISNFVPWKLFILSILCAGFLFIGLFTQITIIVAFLTLIFIVGAISENKLLASILTILITIVCLSILLTGPGIFAFDLPL